MTPNRDEMVHQAATQGKDRNSRRLLLLLSVVLLLSMLAVTIGGYLLWNEKQRQAMAGKDLAQQVQAACTDAELKVDLGSICSQAKAVEAQITAGPQGPPGLNGHDGRDGVNGINGVDGKDGAPGANGRNGTNGLNGQDGKDGAPGPAGPPGEPGKDGADGKDGTDGQNAFPMSWTFEFSPNPAQNYQFECVLLDPSTQVNCTQR